MGDKGAAGVLVVSLIVVLVHVFGINIDGQLQVIKSDCFERLAIGHRLDPKDVYRSTNAKTVTDCRKECTDDDDKCRTFSFGIGIKGNTTCELSSHVVKETLDFQPIGTKTDTDYDLYIKKLGCKLVLENQKASGYEVTEHPHHPLRPQYRPRPQYGGGGWGEAHRVQTLVGVRPLRPLGHSSFHEYDRTNGSYKPSFYAQYFENDLPRPILDGPRNPGRPSAVWPGLYPATSNKISGVYGSKFPHQKPIITETIAPNGQIITSIITEINDGVCFRRALAGRRVARAFVRRSLSCERIEDCQQECADEKHFVCEGFNYRLDPTGRGRGDCELLQVPYVRLDRTRDILHDPDCDYYAKDRNGFPDCKGHRPVYALPSSYLPGNEIPSSYRPPYGSRRPYYGTIRPISGDILPPYSGSRPQSLDGGGYRYDRPSPGFYPTYKRRNDYHTYEDSYSFHSHDHLGHHYPGIPYVTNSPDYKPPYDYKSYEPHLPSYHYYSPYHVDREKDRRHWGFDKQHDRTWGSYGGVYGNFGGANAYYQNRRDHGDDGRIGGAKDWGKYGGSYGTGGIDNYVRRGGAANEIAPPRGIVGYSPSPSNPSDVNDECSLRSAAGFRLYNGVVEKIFSAPGVYECELLCFNEVDFACNSYAYRYTTKVDNCYLSDRNYKELDYYTDIEQDRDCDVYTMHNRNQCGRPLIYGGDECFLLARSGQRLHQSCVKDSLNVGSIVECQIECLKCIRFTCRTFSFRHGPAPLAGVIDNCQLSDVPYYDLDPRSDLVTESGFVLYERRSFGRGCELAHLPLSPPDTPKFEELCYIGYVHPAVLLPEATRKSLKVASEAECRRECTRCRKETIFHCMSFSYSASGSLEKPNCFLSDIYQRDLTEKIDYIRGPNSWLFAWDHYNPKCYPSTYNDPPWQNDISRRHEYNLTNFLYDNVYGLDTWKMYSVGGWPCKRGTCCRQDREIGFWFCELEGGSPSAWDYCCRPDHHCGYSRGYPYQWCYVGSSSTQWRKCNDRYYPYTHPIFKPPDVVHPPYPPSSSQGDHREPRPWVTRPVTPDVVNTLQPPHRPSFRPDRPSAPPTFPPTTPSLDRYEMQFDQQFLDPPQPGGFGQPRHWPVSYLHKDKPPNVTAPKLERPKLEAIQNLIDVIKSNDLKDVRYQITNRSDKADDVLLVRISLPSNFSTEKSANLSEPIDFLPLEVSKAANQNDSDKKGNVSSAYRKGYVTKTSVANHGRKTGFDRELKDDDFSIF